MCQFFTCPVDRATTVRSDSVLLAIRCLCLSLTLGLLCSSASAAEIGEVLWQSGALGLDDIRGAAAAADRSEVRIVGQDAGSAAMQRIGLPASPTGTLAPDAVQLFWSLSLTANGGGSGFTGGLIQEVAYRPDGSWLAVGDSEDDVRPRNRTFWTSESQANLAGNFGTLTATSPNGLFAGADGSTVAVGSTTQPMTTLINSQPGQGVSDMTSDASYLVGQQIYRATNVATLSYVSVDTSSWTVPNGALGLPSLWAHVAKTADGVYFAGEVIDGDTFAPRVGVWREDGTLLGVTDLDDTLADMTTVEGQLVLTVNGTNGGTVYLPTTTGPTAGLGPRIDLSSRLGTSDDTIVPDTTFASELGMVIHTGEENIAVSIDLIVPPTSLPVETAVHQGNYATDVLSLRTASFEVGVKGSEAFDVATIDRATLFIGDVRNTNSGLIQAVKVKDVDRDGFPDAILKVRTAGAIAADTTELQITGQTQSGATFVGTRPVTVTTLTVRADWQTTHGSNWRTLYQQYTRTLHRTWW